MVVNKQLLKSLVVLEYKLINYYPVFQIARKVLLLSQNI